MTQSIINTSDMYRMLVGYCNLLFATLGIAHGALTGIGYSALPDTFIREYGPFMTYHHRFAVMECFSFGLLLPLFVLGVLLVKRELKTQSVLVASKGWFVVEILCFVIILWNWNLGLSPLSLPVIACGLMNVGLALQMVTAYPLIALAVLTRKS